MHQILVLTSYVTSTVPVMPCVSYCITQSEKATDNRIMIPSITISFHDSPTKAMSSSF